MDSHRTPTPTGDGSTRKASGQTCTAPVDQPMFTFIDHDDDLSSKRIRDVNARKAIRSHVMRDVRRRERLAGLKRGSKRESRVGKTGPLFTAVPEHSEDPESEQALPLRTATPSSGSSSITEPEPVGVMVKSKQRRRRPTVWRAGYPTPSSPAPRPFSFPRSWLLDPFKTLPGADEVPSIVAHLVFYLKSVFVPITFPKERDLNEQTGKELMVRSSFSDPGSFFGLMSMCAAHRAVLARRHADCAHASKSSHLYIHDADYYIMKAKCIREMNAKMRDPDQALSDEAFDTIVNLLTSCLIFGLFDEARIHLKGLKRMVELRGGITDDSIHHSSTLAAILTADVKAASGLMTKPIFPLTWDSQPVPLRTQQRIKPPSSSALNRLGAAFFSSTLLSVSLLRILQVIRDSVLYSQAYKESPTSLYPEDHHLFRVVNCEVEHQLLNYIYAKSESGDISSETTLDIHPIEAVTRVASICWLNYFFIVSPPSTGLGRALTKNLKEIVSNVTLPQLSKLSKENFGLLAWALFVGAQGSVGQIEHPWFVERVKRVALLCDWRSWDQVSDILLDYFYLPNTNELIWKSAWDEAMAGLAPDVIEV